MPVFTSDRLLLDAFRAGDRAALTKVYWHYVDTVTRLIRFGFWVGDNKQRVPGVTDAATQTDILQEVFARAFSEKSRLAYNALQPYRPYLLRIAKNFMIDRLRSSGREVLSRDGEALEAWGTENETLWVDEENLDGDPEWQRLASATREFVTGLPKDEQRFVELRFTEDLSQYEVADKLGATRGKIRQLEGKVQSALRAFLRKRGLST